MKPFQYWLCFCFVIGLTGCAALGTSVRRTGETIIVKKKDAALFRKNVDDAPGDSIGMLTNTPGDTIRAVGTRINKMSGDIHYMVLIGTDTVYVKNLQVLSVDDDIYMGLSSTFRLPRAQDPSAWARATVFINRHSDMKIQTASENLIQTYNPIDKVKKGFTITRVPQNDEVEYSIECITASMFTNKYAWEREMAFYMKTGREYKDLLSR